MPKSTNLRTSALTRNGLGNMSPTRPTSPTFSATTDASQMDLSSVETIITRKDLRSSVQAYDDLMSSCTAYRKALKEMATACSNFAHAMDNCARLKGVTDDAGVNFQAAGGLHYLMGNHWDVLSHTLDHQFEEPLRQHLGHYKAAVVERSAAYERTLVEKSKVIKRTEAENLNHGRRKQRDLQSFRQALSVLQAQVDELDQLKVTHYNQVLDHEEETWDAVAGKVCLVVRSSLDMFDRITSKATDSVLETMVQSIPDPFDSYGPPAKDGQLFSILTPLAMTPDTEVLSEGNQVWGGDFSVSFPRSETSLPEWDGVQSRTRRHSAPMVASSSTSTLNPPRRHPNISTVLSVIEETRGKADAVPSMGEELVPAASQSPDVPEQSCDFPTTDYRDPFMTRLPSSPSIDGSPPPLHLLEEAEQNIRDGSD